MPISGAGGRTFLCYEVVLRENITGKACLAQSQRGRPVPFGATASVSFVADSSTDGSGSRRDRAILLLPTRLARRRDRRLEILATGDVGHPLPQHLLAAGRAVTCGPPPLRTATQIHDLFQGHADRPTPRTATSDMQVAPVGVIGGSPYVLHCRHAHPVAGNLNVRYTRYFSYMRLAGRPASFTFALPRLDSPRIENPPENPVTCRAPPAPHVTPALVLTTQGDRYDTIESPTVYAVLFP